MELEPGALRPGLRLHAPARRRSATNGGSRTAALEARHALLELSGLVVELEDEVDQLADRDAKIDIPLLGETLEQRLHGLPSLVVGHRAHTRSWAAATPAPCAQCAPQ
jgi:hypothetical protein